MTRRSPVEVRKESLFLRVMIDGSMTFEDVTRFVGKKAPYPKFSSIASARVSDKIVSFTMQQVPKRLLQRRREEELYIPRSPLSHLEGSALKMMEEDSLKEGQLVVLRDDERHEFTMQLTDSGVLSLEPVNETSDEPFEIPARPLRFDFFFRSPRVDRVLAVNFNGYLDRAPGEAETLTRVVLKAIHSLIPMANFQVLSGITSTDQPTPPAAAPVMPAKWAGGDVEFYVPTWLYAADNNTAVAGGNLRVVMNLEHTNHMTGQLLFDVHPDEALAEHYGEYSRIGMAALGEMIAKRLPVEDQRNIGYDIILGDVSDETVERIRDAVSSINSTLLLTPTLHQETENTA